MKKIYDIYALYNNILQEKVTFSGTYSLTLFLLLVGSNNQYVPLYFLK